MGCGTLLEAMEPQHWSKLEAGGGAEEGNMSKLSEQANCKHLALSTELIRIKTVYILDFLKSVA